MADNPVTRRNADYVGAIDDPNDASPANPVDDVESQMRRALGLYGRTPKTQPEQQRNETAFRSNDRGSNPHKRRFVQDGEVPVTVLRRDPSEDGKNSSNRLQRVEAVLVAEVAVRKQVERALLEAQAQVVDLQTKLGHSELARSEAVESLQRQREIAAELRVAGEAGTRAHSEAFERIEAAERMAASFKTSFQKERAARLSAESDLAIAEGARRSLQSELDLLRVEDRRLLPDRQIVEHAKRSPAKKAWKSGASEPVQWWLKPAKGGGST